MTSPSASESSPRPDLSDMRPNNDWVARYLPASWGPYARLCRLDRPVGTWLTLLPALAALVQAADGIPTLWRVVIFSLGALLMRGIGCCFNDMADRNFDHQVERTRFRPLTSGQLTAGNMRPVNDDDIGRLRIGINIDKSVQFHLERSESGRIELRDVEAAVEEMVERTEQAQQLFFDDKPVEDAPMRDVDLPRVPGAILRVKIDPQHWLAFGSGDETAASVMRPVNSFWNSRVSPALSGPASSW